MGCPGEAKAKETKPGPAAEWQFAQARDLWKRYKAEYIPLENKQIQQLLEFRSPGEMTEAKALASATARQNTPDASNALNPNQAPNSPGNVKRALALESVGGDAQANAAAMAQQQQEARYQQGLQSIINYGLGKASTALNMSTRATSNEAGVNAAKTSQQNYSSLRSADNVASGEGLVAGMATMGAANKWGTPGAPAAQSELAGIQDSPTTANAATWQRKPASAFDATWDQYQFGGRP